MNFSDNINGPTENKIDVVGLDEFFAMCHGKVHPYIIRLDFVEALPVEAMPFLPKGLQMAMAYAEAWLDIFSGEHHTVMCSCCLNEVECVGDSDHEELGALAVIQSKDFDREIGGMVFGICLPCAEQYDDTALHRKISQNLGKSVEEPPKDEKTIEQRLKDIFKG